MVNHELQALAWKVARVRHLGWKESQDLLTAVNSGVLKLNPTEVAAEVEATLTKYRLHLKCADHVREYGAPIYGMDLDPTLCHGCAKPMACSGGDHNYREISATEAHARGVYHGGRCYHVEVCTHCDHVFSYDSSD